MYYQGPSLSAINLTTALKLNLPEQGDLRDSSSESTYVPEV